MTARRARRPDRDPDASSDESPAHRPALPRYFIARYPVTVAQWRVYYAAVVSGTWEPRRPDGEPCEPLDPQSLEGEPTHPVVHVSWYDAIDYGRWLTAVVRQRALDEAGLPDAQRSVPRTLAALLLHGDEATRGRPWVVTLPSEAEWERAARGRRARIYPWGDEWDADAANTWESDIDATSAVGCFPRGATPRREGGVEELSGNVWEWTRSLSGPGFGEPEFRYPYEPDYRGRERENLSAPDDVHRVVRGGSFWGSGDARAADRSGSRPGNRYFVLGFRVVVSPFVDPLDL